MRRRTLLAWLTGALSAALAGVVGTPLLAHLFAPLREDAPSGDGEERWIPVGPADAFADGPPQRVSFDVTRRDGWEVTTRRQAAWIVPRTDGLLVLSTVCPHLGCSIEWAAAAFACPCHDSEFAPDGERRYGPARRGMDPLPHRIRGGLLEVAWVEYAAGSAERTVTSRA